MANLLLSYLPTIDPQADAITAVIETPKGSPNKYDYDRECAGFRLAGVMPEGCAFPYDFRVIPSTLGEDGTRSTCWYSWEKGKVFEPRDRCGPKKARKLVERTMTAFGNKRPELDQQQVA